MTSIALLWLAGPGTAQDSTATPPPAPVLVDTAASAPDTLTAPKPDTTWKRELVAGFNVASSYYQDWSQGGEDNIAWTFNLKGRLEHVTRDWNWTNTGSVQFGQVKLGAAAIRKTDDAIKGESVLSRKLSKYIDPYLSGSFQTQFARGYLYPSDTLPRVSVSNFLDPLYLVQSAGIGSNPVKWLRTRLGASIHEVRADQFLAWTNDPLSNGRKSWKVEPGIEWVNEFKLTVAQRLLLESTLSTFSNFKGWDEVVLDWTSTASYQLGKYINVNASGQLHRDLQQFDGWQWKHRIALGLTYSFL